MSRSIDESRRSYSSELRRSGVDRPDLDVDLILSFFLNVPRSWLHCHGDSFLPEHIQLSVEEAVARRLSREPLHYILGSCPFWGGSFDVGPGCLVPRPETESLVEAALESFDDGLFVDWGTGSGCIACSVLSERSEARALAIDSEPSAIRIAYSNLKKNGLAARCLLWHCSDPKRIPTGPETVDLIVSNPPYIPSSEVPGLMPEVYAYEPSSALDGGSDGLDPYRILLPWAEKVLKSGCWLWVEFGGGDQVDLLKKMTPSGLVLRDIRNDLSGIPRLMGWRRV